jgi:hypothetical protein
MSDKNYLEQLQKSMIIKDKKLQMFDEMLTELKISIDTHWTIPEYKKHVARVESIIARAEALK